MSKLVDQSQIDQKILKTEIPELDYQPRTLKVAIRAFKDINGQQPTIKVLFDDYKTIDLAKPNPWREGNIEDSFGGKPTKCRFRIEVNPVKEEFYPREFKDYLRFDLAVWGEVLGGSGEASATSSAWIHPDSPHGALRIILGPLASGPTHFVFAVVFQK